MSKIQKSALALAVAAAFGLPAMASAATVTGPGALGGPALVVYYTVVGGVANLGASSYAIAIQAGDNLAGRTTGLGVKITLPTGVGMAVAPTVALGSGAGTGAGGSAVVSSFSGNTLIVNVTPNAGGLNLSGPIITVSGLNLTGATALASASGTLPATVVMYDPVTTAVLNTTTTTLADGTNPIKITTTASGSPALIDVGTTGAGNTNNLSKVLFSNFGQVNGSDVAYFDAGTVAASLVAGSIDGSTGAAYVVAGTDTLTTSLSTTGGTFAPFGGAAPAAVVLSTAACSTLPAALAGTVTANAVAFAAQLWSTNTYNVCFEADGKTTLLAGSVAASTVFTHGTIVTTPQGGALQPLAYNGPVQIVYTFNPATNTTQQSFLRVSNTSSVAGPVTITGVDDSGTAAAGQVSFTLAAGHSMQLDSGDLENGNASKGLTGALGHGTGKWILTVTGQMPTMEVTNLNRNNNSGTVNNLGTPVDGAH